MNHSTPGLPVHYKLPESTQLMPIESVMPSSHLILCHPLPLLPPIPPSIRVFSSESTLRMRWPKYWSYSFSISPSNEHPGLIWVDNCDNMYSVKRNFGGKKKALKRWLEGVRMLKEMSLKCMPNCYSCQANVLGRGICQQYQIIRSRISKVIDILTNYYFNKVVG